MSHPVHTEPLDLYVAVLSRRPYADPDQLPTRKRWKAPTGLDTTETATLNY
jgi:hypothetical protein